MDLGAGIAIAGAAFSIAAIAIKWMGKNSQPQCNLHALIEGQIKSIESWLDKVEKKLDRVIEKV